MTHEIIIITCRHDSRLRLDKEHLKEILSRENLEIIRIERAGWK